MSNSKHDRFDELVAPFLLGGSKNTASADTPTGALAENGRKAEARGSYRDDLLRTATALLAAMPPDRRDPREAIELAAELIARIDEKALARKDER
jgi:hypothetical protein